MSYKMTVSTHVRLYGVCTQYSGTPCKTMYMGWVLNILGHQINMFSIPLHYKLDIEWFDLSLDYYYCVYVSLVNPFLASGLIVYRI